MKLNADIMDFRTDKEIRRAEDYERVSRAFRRFKTETGYSDSRIINAMARSREYPFTSYRTIRKALVATNTL